MSKHGSHFSLGYLVQESHQNALTIQAVRITLYLLVLLVSVGGYLLQPHFINLSFLMPFYGFLIAGFGLQICWLYLIEKINRLSIWYLLGFVADGLILSALIHFSGVSQSLFLFLHLVNILLAGLTFQSSGAMVVALVTSAGFSLATLFQPEVRPLQMLFMLALNNVAFFAVAFLSGYLASQLQSVGAALSRAGLSFKELQEFNESLIANLPVGLISFLREGRVVQANTVAEKVFGSDLVDKNIYSLFPELPASWWGNKRTDLIHQTSRGQKNVFGVSMSVTHSSIFNSEVATLLIEDLTQMRALEYQAKQNEKLAAVGGLAAGIAHEIRNPLAGISGSIELLSQTTQNDDDKKLMKIILREIDRLNNLIGEFLEYSRPEKPPEDPVDLVPLLNEVIENVKLNKHVRSDIALHVDMPEQVIILGRRDKLKQAFLNIVLNAFQAMQDSAQPVFKVILSKSDSEVLLRFVDTGCGMSEETKRRMFEPFHTTKSKGTGLGLAVTHKILEGHRAQIFVESEAGKGTEFVMHFPLGHNN